MKIDRDQIRAWYRVFKDNHEAVEIRVIYSDGKTPRVNHRRFNDADAISDFLESLSRPGHAYWTLNELSEARPDKAVTDEDIVRRTWLLVDFDPARPSYKSSTDAEKESANERMEAVRTYLDTKGFPEPCVTDSGNGYHLYYKIDAPNTDETTDIVEAFLNGLSAKFSDDDVIVDTSVGNPSRISKTPGTWAVKGPSTEDRPHRMSKIVSVPDLQETVGLDLVLAVAEDCGETLEAWDDSPILNRDDDNPFTEMHVRKYVEAIEDRVKNGGQIQFSTKDWPGLGYAFKSIGPAGDEYFHRVFCHHPEYNHDFAEHEYNRLKPRATEDGAHTRAVHIETFFYWCHAQGIRPYGDRIMPVGFPFDVFPASVQELIDQAHTSRLKFPSIYTACGVLSAVSCAIGNAYAIELTRGHVENAVLYMALVGGKGKNKSHPLSFAVEPLQVMDDEDYKQYKVEMARYMEDRDRSKKERIGLPEPIRKRHIIDDTTAEALAMAMSDNPRGLLLLNDELIGWIKSQNQYRSGNGADAEMWLKLWSGKSHDVTRKTSGSVRISRPFVSVCGTIQPTIIPTLAENREANGFLDRILFAWPQDVQVEPFSMDDPEMDAGVMEAWAKTVQAIVGIPYKGTPMTVRLSPEAMRLYIDWQRAEAEKCNELDRQRIRQTDDVPYNGIHAKMESYCLRFSLILEVLSRATDGVFLHHVTDISPESMSGALRLCEYFTDQALAVRRILDSSDLDLLDGRYKRFYLSLPNEFTTDDAMKKAKDMGINERSVYRFLNGKNAKRYFSKEVKGNYVKTIKS